MRLGMPESADRMMLQYRQKSFAHVGVGGDVGSRRSASIVSSAGAMISRKSSSAKSISVGLGMCHSTC